ncbi:LacI family transcriptional regulator [Nocardiopsis dassonvillei]|uniref:LacI family DNA-binding transcriptional regulator n=1 Tax=Nocardiopsis dassonvillei TaxID=2014 RepID=UPI00200BFCE8|nr:LacI family DNA-binding transcriptional regulator [Nocardiopsis dassonvillei]MCK9873489.1 LacI family transcriptional regulator [Nocardiopsis dassonvillei]
MVSKSEDVARAAGVSRATVSQILNGRGQRFAEATRARVLQIAAEMEYRPSIAGRALAMGVSDIVVAVLPYTDLSPNLQAVLEHATDVLAAHNLTLVLQLTTPGGVSLAQMVASLRPRAVMALWPFSDGDREVLKQAGVAGISPSEFDNGFDLRIGRSQAEYLMAQGYQRLAYVHLDDERFAAFSEPRERGVVEVCAEGGLPEPVVLRSPLAPGDVLAVIDALPDHTGIACYNDDLAIALLHAASIRGRTVPSGLGIIGMDDSPLAATTHPRLTTVSVDVTTAATAFIRVLLAELGITGDGLGSGRDLVPEIVAGESA